MHVLRQDDAHQSIAREHAELLDVLHAPLKEGPKVLYLLLWSRRVALRDGGWIVTLHQGEAAKELSRIDTTAIRRWQKQLEEAGLISLVKRETGDWRIVWWRECGKLVDGLSVEEGDPQRELFEEVAAEEAGDEVTEAERNSPTASSLASSAATPAGDGQDRSEVVRHRTLAEAREPDLIARDGLLQKAPGRPETTATEAARGSPRTRNGEASPREAADRPAKMPAFSPVGENAGEFAASRLLPIRKKDLSTYHLSSYAQRNARSIGEDSERATARGENAGTFAGAAGSSQRSVAAPKPLRSVLGEALASLPAPDPQRDQAQELRAAEWINSLFGSPADFHLKARLRIARAMLAGRLKREIVTDLAAWAKQKHAGGELVHFQTPHAAFCSQMYRKYLPRLDAEE